MDLYKNIKSWLYCSLLESDSEGDILKREFTQTCMKIQSHWNSVCLHPCSCSYISPDTSSNTLIQPCLFVISLFIHVHYFFLTLFFLLRPLPKKQTKNNNTSLCSSLSNPPLPFLTSPCLPCPPITCSHSHSEYVSRKYYQTK